MNYFTGAIHGHPGEIAYFCNSPELTETDVLVILGDVEANYSGGRRDELIKTMTADWKPTIFCIHATMSSLPKKSRPMWKSRFKRTSLM